MEIEWLSSMLIDDQEADERTFDLTDGQSASVITVPGIDDALAIVRNDPAYNSLAMRRNLNHSIECRMDPMYAEAPVLRLYRRCLLPNDWLKRASCI